MPTMTDARPGSGRVAGIDYGTVRLGIAISDPERTLASPWATYTRRDPAADAEYLRRIAGEEQIMLFVVGLPVHLSGEESHKSREARAFGAWLERETGIPVEFFDERFSSVEAERALGMGSLSSKKRHRRRDMLAAQIMLTAYLSRSPASGEGSGPLDSTR
jgi:putative Holliday junction resolvase